MNSAELLCMHEGDVAVMMSEALACMYICLSEIGIPLLF